MADGMRVAELLTALSLATDLGQGQPMDWELRSGLLALGLADAAGFGTEDRGAVYDLALLRYVGCTSHAHEVAALFGDEIEARGRFLAFDLADKAATGREIVGRAGRGRPLGARIATVLGTLAAGTGPLADGFRASCEVATRFATQLGFDEIVRTALSMSFERWDGTGFPAGVDGDEIPLPMRAVQLAQDAEVLQRRYGTDDAVALVKRRAGSMYDPALTETFVASAPELFGSLDGVDPWDAVLAAEPEPCRVVHGRSIDEALVVLADYTDLKSVYTAGHSRRVADLSAAAAVEARLDAASVSLTRRAGLVHDLGASAVPNSIWDKSGPLTVVEWERVRLHAYYTERILERSGDLRGLASIAGAHQERADGSGYHRGARAATLPLPARLVGAADVYVAITEDRAHRPARSASVARDELIEMVRSGALDQAAVDCVLAASGHTARPRASWPGGLTDREVEVLRLIVRGRTAKDVARELSISVKTVGSHIEHIYAKIGVSTRGAAALYAMQHGLVTPNAEGP